MEAAAMFDQPEDPHQDARFGDLLREGAENLSFDYMSPHGSARPELDEEVLEEFVFYPCTLELSCMEGMYIRT